jgi:integrase
MKVSIYPRMVRGVEKWCVDAHLASGRTRQFFTVRRKAEEVAANLKADANAGATWTLLSDRERMVLAALSREAEAEGTTLSAIVAEWRQLKRDQPKTDSISLGKAIDLCCQEKAASGRRAVYVAGLRRFLCRFAKGRETTAIAAIGPADIREWLAPVSSLGYRATWLNRLSALFSWTKRAGYITANPCESIERVRIETNPVECLTVEQCRDLLEWTRAERPRYLALLVLELLCGLRPDEAEKITWADVDLAGGTVTVDASKTKVRTRRIVHLTESATAWIVEAVRLKAELPVPDVSGRRHTRAMRERLGLKAWPVKLLRKTAASYLMAAWQDAGKVADQLGHSPGVLLKNYRALVKREEAERWMKLRLSSPLSD